MKKRFIFDENYIKRYAKKDKMRGLIIGASVLVLIIVVIVVILATRKPTNKPNTIIPNFELKEVLKVEAGSKVPDVALYFNTLENIDINAIEVIYPEEFEVSYDTSTCTSDEIYKMNNEENVNFQDYACAQAILKSPNVYGVTIRLLEKEYTVKLIVEDTQGPNLTLMPVTRYTGESYQVDDFVEACYDANDECTALFYDKDTEQNGDKIDYSAFKEPGEYTIKIIAIDKFGNESLPMETKLTILEPVHTLYTVSFNTDGGSSIDSVKIEENNTIREPESPSKDGYTFVGWYHNNKVFDFTTPITNDITLVAKWKKNESTTPVTPVNPGQVMVSSISLNYQTIYLTIGSSKTVTATVKPSNAVNKSVSWTSSDKSIATVVNGKITGLKAGTATISATAGGKTAKMTVIVKEASGSSCTYGDASYNSSKYTLSVNLTKNGCAVDPNMQYNETISATDIKKLIDVDLPALGFTMTPGTYSRKVNYVYVKNNSGTGLVGFQITVSISVDQLSATYIINSDGSRKFISNNICKNGNCLK